MTPQFLTLPDRRLAYQLRRGAQNAPWVVFLGGYASDMTGSKAEFLAERCAKADVSFLRFDYRGHGQSSGAFTDGTIGAWLEDAETVVDQLTSGRIVLVGSSMGGWIGLLLARSRLARVKAFIGIAAGPDFTEDLVEPHLTDEQKDELDANGLTYFPAPPPTEPLPITRKLLDEAPNHLVLREPFECAFPVRLLQGMHDDDIPWQHALRIAHVVTSGDVRVHLIKDGGHRLSRPQDLDLLWTTLEPFL